MFTTNLIPWIIILFGALVMTFTVISTIQWLKFDSETIWTVIAVSVPEVLMLIVLPCLVFVALLTNSDETSRGSEEFLLILCFFLQIAILISYIAINREKMPNEPKIGWVVSPFGVKYYNDFTGKCYPFGRIIRFLGLDRFVDGLTIKPFEICGDRGEKLEGQIVFRSIPGAGYLAFAKEQDEAYNYFKEQVKILVSDTLDHSVMRKSLMTLTGEQSQYLIVSLQDVYFGTFNKVKII